MSFSRRELSVLLPALAASAVAQEKQLGTLPSKIYHTEEIPYRGNEKQKGRQFFDGKNHSGFRVEVHENVLGTGAQPHAPNKHEHEEILIVAEGALETYLEGKIETAQAGSVIYLGSNQMHSVRNTGATPCRYYVIGLRGLQA